MHLKKAQTAVELLSVYGWVILVVLIVLAMAYYSGYLNVVNMLPSYCNFIPTMNCYTFKFGYAQDGKTMALNYMITNGLGYDIMLGANATAITVENIGKLGKNTYTGNCVSSESPVRQGDRISCTVLIPDSEVIPTANRKCEFKVAVTYGNCNAVPNYTQTGDCAGAPNYTVSGWVRTQLESNTTRLYGCGSGVCDYALGENSTACCFDCPIGSISAVANLSMQNGGTNSVNVTARYRDGSPAANATITFSANASSNTFTPNPGITNSTGQVNVVYTGSIFPRPADIAINVTSICSGKTMNLTVRIN